MIGASGLSGDTLIACHFPLLPLPAWQLPVQALCGSAKRPGLSGLTRAASLPEQGTLRQEHPITSSRRHFSGTFSSLNEDRAEEEDEEGTSDSASSLEEATFKKEEGGARGGQRSHNSFLPNPDLDEDDEDSDGDNLHKYHEDSSFVLHGTSTWLRRAPASHRNLDIDWGHENLLQGDCGSGVMDMDRLSCCIHSQTSSEFFPNIQTECTSDSSCDSSDGILVNFCAMYNRSNNPAAEPSPSSEGSVVLNLQPVYPSEVLQQRIHSPLREDCPWSPQGLESNCHQPPGLSSLEMSDLAACFQSQATLAMGTNQKYYKLVTCDLSSQSPVASWSSVTCCHEDHSPSQASLNARGQHCEDKEKNDQVASTSKEKDSIQAHPHIPCLFCFNHNSTCQVASAAPTQEPILLDHVQATEKGTTATHFSKPQRPTTLPIQPIVLGPRDRPQAQAQQLGCLVERYIKQKNEKKKSCAGFKREGKSFSNVKPPSLADSAIFLEACSSSDTCSTCTPSSSDGPNRGHMWSQANHSPRISEISPGQGKTSPKNSGKTAKGLIPDARFVRIPTYQDLISLTTPKEAQPQTESLFESALSHMTPQTSQANPHSQTSQPQADSCFSLKTALSSAAPLNSLGSLLSFTASGMHPHQTPKGISESDPLLPTDACFSPDTSYESLSISHLQRRGLLRSVSMAVDLIIAHFGSSRDPAEKMRLGTSSLSPMIASLVLDRLCPALQNVLEDGLRDHKLDVVVGQRRITSWSVVEVSTKTGPSLKVLHGLVCKIMQCPQLSSNSMRLRAFLMGLLNLRALEFWLRHLHGLKHVVAAHYHCWGFLSMSLGCCQPLFQELLLLLQPLSVLPFELDLLLEPRLLRHRPLECVSPTPACPRLSVSRRPSVMQVNRSRMVLASVPEWRPEDPRDCCHNGDDIRSPVCRKESGTASISGLRWAKLFGAASTRLQTTTQSRTAPDIRGCRRPSQWLYLDSWLSPSGQ
ncbi:AP-4 complex accessory subunit RUSC2 [Dunckerocampus dactyliophorus]|uniref:AP-4 complex accessory subunit RUSC2 n=1 Tax=Dunckerocampus dactyliophorus TaxID=161453 RepID=UPI0024053CC5|nr:AP-4 complex accessory subunit RUSC2 [Dunckerocampus dactyliophorus]XP_054612799.1 AP-4 complex accessory subunit RUSC2 [Dunckerocampus dactyliophorus]